MVALVGILYALPCRARLQPQPMLRLMSRVSACAKGAAAGSSVDHLKPKNPRIARMMTIAPTHQMMLFTVCSSQPIGKC